MFCVFLVFLFIVFVFVPLDANVSAISVVHKCISSVHFLSRTESLHFVLTKSIENHCLNRLLSSF